MTRTMITPNQTVEEVLTRWSQTISVFVRRKMGCVGCAMAPFETLTDAARIYGLPLDSFLNELEQTIQSMEVCNDDANQ